MPRLVGVRGMSAEGRALRGEQELTRSGRAAPLAGYLLSGVLLASLLALHARDAWQYIHDDNGRRYSSYARSHLTLGLRRTRGNDFFYDPQNATLVPYGHHPPGLGLLLAGWFKLWHADTPLVARALPSAFHLITALLLFALLHHEYPGAPGIVGAFAFAVVPMSSFFGKVVNFEPVVLPFVILLVTAYWRWAESGGQRLFALSLLLVPVAALIDWMILLALCTVGLDCSRRYLRGEGRRFLRAALVTSGLGLTTFLAIVAWMAGGPAGGGVLASSAAFRMSLGDYSLARWGKAVVRYNHWYFTRPLHYASIVMLALCMANVCGRRHLEARLRLILLFAVAGILPIVLFPSGSFVHAYWQLYLLPYAILSFAYLLSAIPGAPIVRYCVYGGVSLWVALESAWILRSLYASADGYVLDALSKWQPFL